MATRMTLSNGDIVSLLPVPGGALFSIGDTSRILGIGEMRDLGKDLLSESKPDRALVISLRSAVRWLR